MSSSRQAPIVHTNFEAPVALVCLLGHRQKSSALPVWQAARKAKQTKQLLASASAADGMNLLPDARMFGIGMRSPQIWRQHLFGWLGLQRFVSTKLAALSILHSDGNGRRNRKTLFKAIQDLWLEMLKQTSEFRSYGKPSGLSSGTEWEKHVLTLKLGCLWN